MQRCLLILVLVTCTSSCNFFPGGEGHSRTHRAKGIPKPAYHFDLTTEQQQIIDQQLSQLSSSEREERARYYCGKLGDKSIRLPKKYAFTPLNYEDISFRHENGWKAKLRWCEDPIISFSIAVDWPSLEPARSEYGFDHLEWGTYDRYLVEGNIENANKDYSGLVIYAYGTLTDFSEASIRQHPNNLKPYLISLFKLYKLTPDKKPFLRKDLNLEQLEVPVTKGEVITLYWHQANDPGKTVDLAVECRPVPNKIYSFCTGYFFPNKPSNNLIASFVVTEENLVNWPELVKKADLLLNSFFLKKYPKPKITLHDVRRTIRANSSKHRFRLMKLQVPAAVEAIKLW
ncbi:MAG: hypothetical protein WDW21_03995 [Neisseriaceae bacterium]